MQYTTVASSPIQTAPAYVRGVTVSPDTTLGIQTGIFDVQFSRPMDITIAPLLTLKDSWATKANMPTARLGLGVATASNGKIYAIGGYDNSNNHFLATVEEYDPATNIWKPKANMPTARYSLGVTTTSNGKIYAIGGNNTGDKYGHLATVQEYDPATDIWTTKASMPTLRSELGVTTTSNGKIYAIGGNNGNSLATVEEYNPITDTWTAKANMPTARSGLAVITASNGRIYAIGGYNNNISNSILSTVEEYDPGTDTWTTKANMPTARWGLGVTTASNGKIYAIGGNNNSSVHLLSTVEEYNPATDIWTTKVSMPTLRARIGVTTASNGKIYAIGGYNNNGNSILSTVEEYTLSGGEININPTMARFNSISCQL